MSTEQSLRYGTWLPTPLRGLAEMLPRILFIYLFIYFSEINVQKGYVSDNLKTQNSHLHQ